MVGDPNVDFRDWDSDKYVTDLYILPNEFGPQPTVFDITRSGSVKLGSYINNVITNINQDRLGCLCYNYHNSIVFLAYVNYFDDTNIKGELIRWIFRPYNYRWKLRSSFSVK